MMLLLPDVRISKKGAWVYATTEQWVEHRPEVASPVLHRELIFVRDNGTKVIVQFEDEKEISDLIKRLKRIQSDRKDMK